MAAVPSASHTLDREFLGLRARLIELAATLDRIDRAEDSVADDPRIETIHHSLDVLADDAPDRAARVQRLFSLPYDENWRAT
jgi:hypothetical protein